MGLAERLTAGKEAGRMGFVFAAVLLQIYRNSVGTDVQVAPILSCSSEISCVHITKTKADRLHR